MFVLTKPTTTTNEPRMLILHDILEKLKSEFAQSRKGNERGIWFVYTIVAIIIPFPSSKTSNILRCLNTLFGFTGIRKKRFYTFMASPKIRETMHVLASKITAVEWTTICCADYSNPSFRLNSREGG